MVDDNRKAAASLSTLAAIFGKSKQAAAKWKAKGYLVLRGEKIDLEASVKRLADFGITPSPASTAAGSSTEKRRDGCPVDDTSSKGGLPAHFAFVMNLDNEADRAAVLSTLQLVYRAPALAALVAEDLGAPAELTEAMVAPLSHALMCQAATILKAMGCEPFASTDDPPIWDTDAFWQAMPRPH